MQQLTVGSPQPFSGYETSDFYYTAFGMSQDIPGPGKLGLRARQAGKEADTAHDAYLVQQRQVTEQVRENYFNLFYLRKMLDSLHETRSEVDRAAALQGAIPSGDGTAAGRAEGATGAN